MEITNATVRNAVSATAKNADNFASDKLRNEWNTVFRSLKRLHDMAAAEKHQSVMDAANAAAKTLMDRTKW